MCHKWFIRSFIRHDIRPSPVPNVASPSSVQAVAGVQKPNQLRLLAESAIMIALATVLNSIKIFTMPEGGTVTLGAMVPLLFLALRRGVKVGMAAGAVFGIIDVYFEPFVYNPIQFLLDYPFAYGALGLAGIFSRRVNGPQGRGGMTPVAWSIAAVALGIFARFVCHFFSGLIFFASYAPAGESPALYSAIYNASYLVPEFFISAFVISILIGRGITRVRL
jgi:thiamine transporter